MRVVNKYKEKYTHYIGRGSVFGNPFRINSTCNRAKSISRYEKYVREQIEENLPENAVLGCYCKPQPCHGDIIIKIREEMHNE